MNAQSKKVNKERLFELDIENLEIDHNGVNNLIWPVSYDERIKFHDILIRKYSDIVTADEHTTTALPYTFAAKYFVIEALGVFYSILLLKRFKKLSLTPKHKPEWRLWSRLFEDEIPEDPPFLKSLKNGSDHKKSNSKNSILKRIKRILSLLSIKESGFSVGNLKLKPISDKVLRDDIIATHRTELIQQHAARVKKDVVFCRSGRWFDQINDTELIAAEQNTSSEIEEQILSVLNDLYREFDLKLTEPVLNYHKHILHMTSLLMSIHYQRLLAVPHQLPVNIWTGTGGNIWDALLRHACLNVHDGEVAGHDHGAALGHVNFPAMSFMELWGCNKFICPNENQAKEMTQTARGWPFLEKNKPKLLGWKSKDKIIQFKKFSIPKPKVKKIIFIVTLSAGDRVWLGPCLSDPVLVDFYARATSVLKEWGYEVILKTHPELNYPPSNLINMASSVRSEPLEKMIDEGDLVLLDHIYTTVFRSVLSTNTPMVLIDFFDYPWTNKALKMIKKRTGFVEGSFDEQNRCHVNWSGLKQAIEEAPDKRKNSEFFDYYYG
jgi:hypothetical protein